VIVKTITIKCACCGSEAEKRKAEINRQIKNGRNFFFCSQECSAKNNSEKRVIHKDILKNCLWCGTEFLSNTKKRARKCCCKDCSSRYSQSHTTEKSRQTTSLKTKKLWTEGKYKYKKRTLVEKNCLCCQKNFQTKRNSQVFCSIRCARTNKKSEGLMAYRIDAKFRFCLNDYPEEFDFSLIEKYGWYQASNRGNNLSGVSRDHILSVKEGYVLGIDPKIIGHPANCQLLVHNENVSKNHRSHISLEDLLLKIEQWEQKYSTYNFIGHTIDST
jgi:YHS domain-containing protein